MAGSRFAGNVAVKRTNTPSPGDVLGEWLGDASKYKGSAGAKSRRLQPCPACTGGAGVFLVGGGAANVSQTEFVDNASVYPGGAAAVYM